MPEKRAREWRIRLAEELRHDSAYFITLTINEQELEKLRKEVEAEKIKDWASQMTFREENIKNEKTKIANQVKQWAREFGLKEDKLEMEKLEIIVNGILEAIKLTSGLGGAAAMGKFKKV